MIIAGETSGDLHGAKLVKAMQKRNKGLFFCGIGGQALKETGVDILIDAREISVVGITEVFSKIPNILRSLRIVKKTFKIMRPDLLILIDFPDFNLHVAATAKKMGIPVLYYRIVCRQLRQAQMSFLRHAVHAREHCLHCRYT